MSRGENTLKQNQGQMEALKELEKMMKGESISLKTPNSPKKQDPFSYGSASPKGKSWRSEAIEHKEKAHKYKNKLKQCEKKLLSMKASKKKKKKKKKTHKGGCGSMKGGGKQIIKSTGETDPKTGKSLQFYCRLGTSDEKVLDEIFTKGAYRKPKINFDVEENDTWIDIGGHIGLFALYAVSKGAKRVYVYEADHENYAMLTKNIKLNNLSNKVKCFRKAVVDDKGLGKNKSIQLYKSKDPSVNYRNSIVPKKRGQAISVPAMKFNEVIQKHSDANGLKIDIEGAEVPILTSNSSKYGKIQKLTFEFTLSSGQIKQMNKVIQSKGFSTDIPKSTLNAGKGAWIDYVVHATKNTKSQKGGKRSRKGSKDLLLKFQKKNIQRFNKCNNKSKNKSKCNKEFQDTWTEYSKFLKKNNKKQYTPKQQKEAMKQLFN
jgi:FkbM family methyltransferase